MKDFTAKFKKIKELDPKRRGQRFERLFYEIFKIHNIYLEKSLLNEDGSQQIDGAVEIKNRIFLVEIKWERSKTLAASKLYSFLGKINSKIEGTLGLFISYNELKENFLNSARAGIKQNCIIIHGEDNIIPIISGEVSLADYVWYIYQQASTRNRISIPINEFKSIPPKKGLSPDNKEWRELYEALISEGTSGEFELKLDTSYERIINLSEKTITLYPILRENKNILSKIDYLLDSLIDNNKRELFNSLIDKLMKSHWIKYADEYILNKIKNISTLSSKKADKIGENALSYLRENYGQWEKENEASLILDFVYDHLSEKYKVKTACAYSEIYCDTSRKEHYPQKKMAYRIFSEIEAKDRWKTIEDEVKDMMEQYKADENIFGYYPNAESAKKFVIQRIKYQFNRIIKESNPKDLDKKLKQLYEQA